MMRAIASAVLVVIFGLCGCGGDDDDSPSDAAIDRDGAVPDAAVPDAGIPDAVLSFCADAAPPGFDAAPITDCNAVSQTGCASGEKCAFIVDTVDPETGHVGCVPDGTAAIGDPCTDSPGLCASDSCAKGGHCYNGYCREICSTLNDQCGSGQCGDFVDGNGNPYPIEWCLFGCDPLGQDCIVANEACYLSGGEGICIVHGDAQEGEPCMFTNTCDTGTQCFGPSGAGVCRRLCGTIEQIWGADGDGNLTWPTCCGGSCGATVDCSLSNEMCWVVSDGTDTGVADVGVCMTDVEASNPDATMPWTCDCSSAAAEKCAFD